MADLLPRCRDFSLKCCLQKTRSFLMAVSLYDVSIPPLIRGLTNLSAVLDKAAAHAEAKKFDPAVLAQARLFPDMHPLTRQVQIACDTAKGAAARLAGIEIPKHEDNEVSLPELKQRIAKTLDFLKTVKAGPNRRCREPTRSRSSRRTAPLSFTGLTYLERFRAAEFLLPRDHAYALLRHNGVEVGKMDFLGAM